MQKERAEYFLNEAKELLNSLNEVIEKFNEYVKTHITQLHNNCNEEIYQNLDIGLYQCIHLNESVCKEAEKQCSIIALKAANLVFGYNPEHPLNILLKKTIDQKFFFSPYIYYHDRVFSAQALGADSLSYKESTSHIEYLIKEFIHYLDSFILPFIEEPSLDLPR